MSRWLIPALAGLYFLSPLDLIPDVMPVIGWLDDWGLLGYAVNNFFQSDPATDSDAKQVKA